MKLRKLAVPSAMALLVLALATASSSCGGGSSDDTSKFIGTWTFDSGMLGTDSTCAVGAQSAALAGQTFTLVKGTSSDLLLTLTTSQVMCQVTFKVAGSTATADPNQMCTFTVTGLGQTSVGVTSWTLVTSNGTTLTTSMVGTAICPVTGSGSASKNAASSGQDGSTGS
jgi:hypothetical protein